MTPINTDKNIAEMNLRTSAQSAAKIKNMDINSTEKDLCLPEAGSPPTPKISVIVPVYKVEKYLPECIDSILAQTFTDFELILVDDGSPDSSGKICDDYAARDSRIRVFHKENGGVSSARNLGLDHARGEWIAFVDSDDTVGEKYLENLWGGNIDSPGPEAGTLVVSGYRRITEKGCIVGDTVFEAGKTSVAHGFCNGRLYFQGYSCSKLYEKRILWEGRIAFDLEHSLCEDELFMLHYLAFCRSISFQYGCSYHYMQRAKSLSSKHQNFESTWKFFLKQRAAASVLNIPSSEKIARLIIFRRRALSALFSLYRPKTKRERSERIKKIQFVSDFLQEDFKTDGYVGFWEWLLYSKRSRAFDFVSSIVFSARHGIMSPLWGLYRRFVLDKKDIGIVRMSNGGGV